MIKPIKRIICFFQDRKKRKEKEREAHQKHLNKLRQQEILEEKRELKREREKRKKEAERAEKERRIRERKNWEQAQEYKRKANKKLLQDIDKNRSKIISEQEFNKPKIRITKTGGILFFKGKKFLFCEEGFERFQEDFLNEEDYILVVDEGYLARKNREQDYIQYFHRWLMREDIEDFLVNDEVEVHHIDLTTTNNKISNLKPMLKEDHEKLHIRLKFGGSDESFENWYGKKHL